MLYLRTESIPGPYTKAAKQGWLRVESMQFGMGRGVSHPTEKRDITSPSISEVTLTRAADALTPLLMNAAVGTTPQTMELAHFPNDSESPAWTMTLTETVISGFSLSTRSTDAASHESISLNFVKIVVETPHKEKFAWDLVEAYHEDKKKNPERYARE